MSRIPSIFRAGLPVLFRGTKFLAVGWMGVLVNSGCLYLLKGQLGFRLIPASVIAIEVAIIHNFLWLRYWAWGDRSRTARPAFLPQLLAYNLATGMVDLTFNVSVLWLLATVFHVYYLIANLAGMLVGPFVKFWLNDRVIFREKRHGTLEG